MSVAILAQPDAENKAKADADPAAPRLRRPWSSSDTDANNFKVDHPEQFPLVTAAIEHRAAPELNVTGVGESGCVAQRAGDLAGLRPRGRDRRAAGRRGEEGPASVQSAQHRYLRRVFRLPQGRSPNEQLAQDPAGSRQASVRSGAIAKSALEVAQNAEDNAQVDVETTAEHLRLLGSDPRSSRPESSKSTRRFRA